MNPIVIFMIYSRSGKKHFIHSMKFDNFACQRSGFRPSPFACFDPFSPTSSAQRQTIFKNSVSQFVLRSVGVKTFAENFSSIFPAFFIAPKNNQA